MGMFDSIRCDFPLPARAMAQSLVYQTKDLDCVCDNFHIREDGTLWGETYDLEDHSDPNAVGFARLIGSLTHVNIQPLWREDFSGTIEFYTDYGVRNKNGWAQGWLSFEAKFSKGRLVDGIRLLEDKVPPDIQAQDNADALNEGTLVCNKDNGTRRI